MNLITPFKAARPVWPKDRAEKMNDLVRFQVQFDVSGCEKATLRLTGSTLYRVFLNGAFLAYGPARGPKGIFRVDEIILPVEKGTNLLQIEVSGSNVNSFYYMDHPSFLQAEIYTETQILAYTGRDFQAYDLCAHDGPCAACARIQKVSRFSYQRMFAEAYVVQQKDQAQLLELEEQPVMPLLPRCVPQPTYSMDTSYVPVKQVRRRYDASVEIPYVRYVNDVGKDGFKGFQIDELKLNMFAEVNRYVKDDNGPIASSLYCGRINNTGFLRLKVNCKKPGRLVVMTAEVEEAQGGVRPTRLDTTDAVFWEIKEAGIYELEALEANTFKYAEVFFDGGAQGEVLQFSLREYKSPLAWNTPFHADDPVLEQIFEAGRETFAANAVDCFTDCPSRERGGWLCDSFFIARTSFLLTGSTLLERVFLENFAYTEHFDNIPEGMFPMVFPSDTRKDFFIPNWAMWLVIETEDYLKRCDDQELKLAFKDKFLALIAYLDSFLNEDGLLEKLPSWVFIEWSQANFFVQDVNYPSNMTYAGILDAVSRMYDMPELAKRAQNMRDIIRRQSWNGQWFCDHAVRQADGSLLVVPDDISETCQYYAFFFNVATPEEYPVLWQRLLNDFGPDRQSRGLWQNIWPSNAFIGNYLRLELLSLAGKHQQVLQESKGYFQKMAEKTGTLWEHDSTVASCCHGFAAYINVLLTRALQ